MHVIAVLLHPSEKERKKRSVILGAQFIRPQGSSLYCMEHRSCLPVYTLYSNCRVIISPCKDAGLCGEPFTTLTFSKCPLLFDLKRNTIFYNAVNCFQVYISIDCACSGAPKFLYAHFKCRRLLQSFPFTEIASVIGGKGPGELVKRETLFPYQRRKESQGTSLALH